MHKLLALTLPGDTPVKIETPPGIPTGINLSVIIRLAIEVSLVIGTILALIFLIYGGIYWMQSSGNKESLDKARKIIIYSIAGMIIMAFSVVIVNVFTTALGLPNLFTLH
jgi:cbb3-type cytochrome oxidase subunit 3